MKNESWIPILEALGIPLDKYDMMYKYIQNHTNHEINNSLVVDKSNQFETTLPMALRVLSKIDLNRVVIVNTPKDIDTMGDAYRYNTDEFNMIPDIEAFISSTLSEEMINMFNTKLVDDKVVCIYLLFSQVINIISESKFVIIHRYSIQDKVL